METLITVRDIQIRYSCSGSTARKYMRQMYHYEKPLRAPLWALTEWERSRETSPAEARANYYRPERVKVPRKRANNG